MMKKRQNNIKAKLNINILFKFIYILKKKYQEIIKSKQKTKPQIYRKPKQKCKYIKEIKSMILN